MAEIGHRYRNISLVDMCRYALGLAGQSAPVDRDECIRAAVSTAELRNIFTNAVNARMMVSYREAPDSTRGMARETEVPDFKENERIGTGLVGPLTRHGRGATADHVTQDDLVEKYQIARYSGKFVVDENRHR